MNPRVTPVAVPPGSEIHRQLPGAYFADAYESAVDGAVHESAIALYLRVIAGTPGWVESLLWMRNRAAALVGLKHVGRLSDVDPRKPAEAYRVGDRVGIFTIRWLSEREVILGDDDKHLHVRLSVWRTPASSSVTVSTVVHVHNLLGRLYMLPVAPVHRLLVPVMLRRLPAVG